MILLPHILLKILLASVLALDNISSFFASLHYLVTICTDVLNKTSSNNCAKCMHVMVIMVILQYTVME